MLLYLTSTKNNGVFDFLENDKNIIIKKRTGEFYLKKYITHEMKNLLHNQFLAIDLSALKDSDDEIIESIQAIKMLYDIRIIVYAVDLKPGSTLLKMLINEKIYNIVTGDTNAEIQRVILKCISPEGLDYDDSQRLLNPDESDIRKQFKFNASDVKVAIAGTHSRAGCTSTAFNLAVFLSLSGAKVSYTEASDNEHLRSIIDYYEFDKIEESQYRYKDIDFFLNKSFSSGYNFQIFDLGVLNQNTEKIFKAFDVKLLCVGSKPYEFSSLNNHRDIEDFKHHMLINFSPEKGRIKFKTLESENRKIHFLGYAPSLFNEERNGSIFTEILNEYMFEI